METGEISQKLKRGKHTTRHAQLIKTGEHTYFMDTPGFSSLFVQNMEKEDLQEYFPEFHEFSPLCRFQGCAHMNEPDCAVKEAVAEGKVHQIRYESYKNIYQELKEKRKY